MKTDGISVISQATIVTGQDDVFVVLLEII
jgi:hypothetical protein